MKSQRPWIRTGVAFWSLTGAAIAVLFLNLVRLKLDDASAEARTLPTAAPPVYVAVLQGTMMTSSGKARGSTQTFAVRADGSHLHRTELLEDSPLKRQISERVLYFATGVRVVVDELRELKMSMQEDGPPRLRDPRSNCLNSYGGRPLSDRQELLGEESLGGLRTVRIRVGAITHWYARDVGCATVRMETKDYELALVKLERREPGPEFFEIPNFKEVPPSDYFRLPKSAPNARARDAEYARRRPSISER